jgi:hypothetical protein
MKEGMDAQSEGFLRAGRGEVVELDLSNLILEQPVKAYLIKQ